MVSCGDDVVVPDTLIIEDDDDDGYPYIDVDGKEEFIIVPPAIMQSEDDDDDVDDDGYILGADVLAEEVPKSVIKACLDASDGELFMFPTIPGVVTIVLVVGDSPNIAADLGEEKEEEDDEYVG